MYQRAKGLGEEPASGESWLEGGGYVAIRDRAGTGYRIAPSVLAGPLHDAAGEGDLANVETLLAEGAKIDARGTKARRR